MSDLGNKQVFASNLRFYMNQHGKKRTDICEALNIKYTTFTDWVNAKKYPRIDNIELLAGYFGIEKSDLIENPASRSIYPSNILPMPETKKLPRLGTIACGEPILAEENIEDWDSVPLWVRADFTLKCKGDSMINARIFDGDVVCIHKQEAVDDGEIAAVLIGDEATLKRVHLFADHIVLQPENPNYRPLSYWEEEMNDVHILGKAAYFISAVR